MYEDRRQLASAAGKKPSVSLSLFLEINTLEIAHGVTCAATCFWAQGVWTGRLEEDMKRSLWEATSWTNVIAPAGAVLGEMKDLGIRVPSWVSLGNE